MAQQVLGSPRTVREAVTAVARAVVGPPSLADLHAVPWPVHDPESLRGAALLEESRLSAESPARLLADHRRLFLGSSDRPPVAPPAAPASAERSLARLLTRAGLTLGTPPGLVGALRAYAVLLDAPPAPACHELVHDHLLTWGAQCLTRVQLGAQTFCYQGVAALGLGLLREAATR